MINKKVQPVAILLLLGVFLFLKAEGQGSVLEVWEKDQGSEGSILYIQKKLVTGGIDPKFKSVACYANPGRYPVTCYPIELASGKFLLADCFGYDAVCQSCRLMRFNSDGTPDYSFKIPFAYDHNDLMGSSINEIKEIHKVEVDQDGDICIKGSFISPLVYWTQKEAQEALEKSDEPGAAWGKPGITCLGKDGSFKLFTSDPSPKTREEKGGRE